jgi:hypothetical protein
VDPGWKKFGSGMNIPDPQEIDKGGVLSLRVLYRKKCARKGGQEIDKGVV